MLVQSVCVYVRVDIYGYFGCWALGSLVLWSLAVLTWIVGHCVFQENLLDSRGDCWLILCRCLCSLVSRGGSRNSVDSSGGCWLILVCSLCSCVARGGGENGWILGVIAG